MVSNSLKRTNSKKGGRLPLVNPESLPKCMFELAQLSKELGHTKECERLFTLALRFWREGGNDLRVGQSLMRLADVNRQLGNHAKGISLAKEGLEIHERLDSSRSVVPLDHEVKGSWQHGYCIPHGGLFSVTFTGVCLLYIENRCRGGGRANSTS